MARLHDSTKTRVEPLFNEIGNDINKINKLFSLINTNVKISSKPQKILFGKNEAAIAPTKNMLEWYVNNIASLSKPNIKESEKRKKLLSGDKEVQKEALLLINANQKIRRKWYILEGYTHPDIYIETENEIFIGEAKRTENNITMSTTYLSPRDQLVRHIDSVLDNEESKKVYSFYIIDESKEQKYNLAIYNDINQFAESLPHRNKKDWERAMETYIGYTTWQKISKEFNISFPDTINDKNN